MLLYVLGTYLIVINLMAFIVFGVDKRLAIKKKMRIRESTLLVLAFIGGAVGALLGMGAWHHKTRKKKFTVTIPIFLVLHIILIVLLIYFRL